MTGVVELAELLHGRRPNADRPPFHHARQLSDDDPGYAIDGLLVTLVRAERCFRGVHA